MENKQARARLLWERWTNVKGGGGGGGGGVGGGGWKWEGGIGGHE